jgi:hypothetical protein
MEITQSLKGDHKLTLKPDVVKNMKDFMGSLDRRALIKNGTVLAGAGLLGSFADRSSDPGDAVASHIYNVRSFGAAGKRGEKATLQIQAAVDACTNAGGGMVYVPPGDYTVGTIQLKDNVNLNVEAGTTLYLSQDRNDFIKGARTIIFAEKASNISLTGKGILDGLADYDFVEMRGVDPEIAGEIEIARKAGIDMRRYYRKGMQTFMCVLNNCTNVLISDISVVHSPLWNIRLNDCDRVSIRGVYIFSDLEKGVNADGIDICSSRNVTISDSIIITADDSIVLKTPKEEGQDKVNPVENIVVTNCVLASSSTPLMIGTETYADIKHVLFNNCTIRNSNKGFGINVQDGATVSNVIFSNLTIETNRRHWNWWGSAELCKFVLSRRDKSSALGKIKDIVIDTIISNVRGTSIIKGLPDQNLENIRFCNVQVFMLQEDAKDKRATHALCFENVRGLKIRDLSVVWGEDQAETAWQSALVLKEVTDFEIRSFSGRQGLIQSSSPAILLDNASNGLVADSDATKGCASFIHIKGPESRDLVLRNNNTKKAKKEISFENKNLIKSVTIN